MELLRLKEALKEKGITGKALAEKVEVSDVAISSIVKGKTFPRPELLLKIAQVLDMDVRKLFYSTKKSDKQDRYINIQDLYIKKDGEFKKLGDIEL